MPREEIVDTRDEKTEESLMVEVRERFHFAVEYWAPFFTKMKKAFDFIHVDQWDAAARTKRESEGRPVIEIDKVSTNLDSVIGDNRMNKASVRVRPADQKADIKTADVYNGLIRAIQRNSKAEASYEMAFETELQGGIGHWRVDKVFNDDEVFEQDLEVNPIPDPFSVLIDPAFKKPDTSDCDWKFVTDKMPRAEFKLKYGREAVSFNAAFTHSEDWSSADDVTVAEYWVKRPIKKRLAMLTDGTTTDADEFEKIQDELVIQGRDLTIAVDKRGNPRIRTVKTHEVVVYFVDGAGIIEGPTVWEGKIIPIVTVFGKRKIVNGKKQFRGAVEKSMDAQVMLNYARATTAESMDMAIKAPIMATDAQLEGKEEVWRAALSSNLPYVTYNGDPNANGPPQRLQGAQPNAAAFQEVLLAADDIKATMGIFGPSIGQESPETSGIAIARRQQGSDKTNFIYHDNLARGVQYTGEILVEMLPHVYDSTRQVIILKEDDQEETVTINEQIFDEETQAMVNIHDLSVGKYTVTATVGPSFATQREEALDSMIRVIEAFPSIAPLVIDLVAKAANWPDKDEFIKRIRKTLPPGITDPTDEEKEELQKQEEAQANQPPGPEQIAGELQLKKLEAEADGAVIDNQKTQAEVAKLLAQVRETQAEMSQTMVETTQIAVEAAVNKVFESLGMMENSENQV